MHAHAHTHARMHTHTHTHKYYEYQSVCAEWSDFAHVSLRFDLCVAQIEKEIENIAVRAQKELILLHKEDADTPRGTAEWLNARGWCSSFHHIRCNKRVFSRKPPERMVRCFLTLSIQALGFFQVVLYVYLFVCGFLKTTFTCWCWCSRLKYVLFSLDGKVEVFQWQQWRYVKDDMEGTCSYIEIYIVLKCPEQNFLSPCCSFVFVYCICTVHCQDMLFLSP